MAFRSQFGFPAPLCLLFFFHLLHVSAGRLLLREPPTSGYSESCKYWLTAVRNPRLIFCQVEPDDSQIRAASITFPVVLDNSARANQKVSRFLMNDREDYVVFMDSKGENLLEDCVSKAFSSSPLSGKTTAVVVCDRSTEFPRKLQRMETLKFLELASVLYLTATECWEASPFYFLKRRFSPVSNCHGTQWMYDWKRLPDMKGQALHVLVLNSTFLTVIDENKSGSEKRYEGLEVSIFTIVAGLLNLTWEMVELAREETVRGKLVGGKYRGGVIQALTSGDGDVALIAREIDYKFNDNIDFTYPWTSVKDVVLVPRPARILSSWRDILRPFDLLVWLAIAMSCISIPLFAWTLDWIHVKFVREHWRRTPLRNYILHTLGAVTAASFRMPSKHVPPALLVMFIFWLMSAQVLYVAFTSNLAAFLSKSTYFARIDSVQELVEQNFTWGRPYPVNPAELLNLQTYWHKRWLQKFIVYDESEERQLIKSGRFALRAKMLVDSNVVMVDSLDDDLVKGLRIVREPLKRYSCATVLRNHSPLKPFYDIIIVLLRERGILKANWRQYLWKYQKFSYMGLMDDREISLKTKMYSLKFRTFKYMLFALAVGWALSSLCFVLELVHHKFCRPHSP